MGVLAKIEAFLNGKKTYIIAIIAGVLTIYQGLGHVIPDYVWTGLAAAGLGAIRSAVGTGKAS